MFKKIQNKDQIFIIFGTILLVALAYPFLLQTLPKFTDMVNSAYSRQDSTNKELELLTIKIIIFLNILFSSIYCYKMYKKQGVGLLANESGLRINRNIGRNDFITIFLITVNLLYFIVKSNRNPVLFDLLTLWIIALFYEHTVSKEKYKYIKGKIIVLFFLIKLNVSTMFMIIRNLFYLGIISSPFINTEPNIINIVSYVVFVIALILVSCRYSIDKMIINAQMILPFLTLALLGNFYTMAGSDEILYKAPPISYIVLIVGLTLVFIVGELIHKSKHYNEYYELEYNDILSLSTLCILGLYVSVELGNYIFVSDLWHNGERLVPYQQADAFSKVMFKDFYPSSGLYSYATGFFMDKFFNNNYFELNFVYSFRDIVIILIFTILSAKVFGKFNAFFIMLIFFINPNYERTILLIPCFLLLNLEKIKKDEIIWIATWALCCLFSILYYPLYGAAFSVGTLPRAIYMGYKLFIKYKNKLEISNLKQKIGLFVGACIIIIWFAPLMFRELYNAYLFSEQTVMVDALSIVGSTSNSRFTNFLASDRLNTVVYQIMLMSVLIITPSLIFSYIPRVWFLIKAEQNEKNVNTEFRDKLINIFLTLCFIFIVIIISYSYTLIRMEKTDFISRSTTVYAYIIGFLFFYTMYKLFILIGRRTISQLVIVAGLFVIVVVSTPGTRFNSIGAKTAVKHYDDNYVYFEDEQIPNLGSGIIKLDDKENLLVKKEYIEKFNTSMWFFDMQQGLYYIFNLDTHFVTAGTFVAGTKEMQEFYFENSLDTMPNVILNPKHMLVNYYLTKSFIDYGYIYVIDEKGMEYFVKEEFFNTYYSEEEKANINHSKKITLDGNGNMYFIWANSLDDIVKETIKPTGVSIDNLDVVRLNQITEKSGYYVVQNTEDPYIQYKLDDHITGFDNDVVYLEIEIDDVDGYIEDNSLQIFYKTTEQDRFDEKHSLKYNMIAESELINPTEINKYLIPMGVSIDYLNNDIEEFRIDFNNLGVGSTVKISNIDFYKYPSHVDGDN